MATPAPSSDPQLDQLLAALKAADAAGNTDDAKALAGMIQARQAGGGGSQQPAAPAPTSTPSGQITNPLLRYPLMVGSNVLGATASMMDLPETIGSLTGDAIRGGVRGLTGYQFPQVLSEPTLNALTPSFSRAVGPNKLNQGFSIDSPALQPSGLGENLLAAGSRAIPAIAADIASGGAAIPATASNLGAAGLSELAYEADPDSKFLPILASLAGGLGISKVMQAREASQAYSQLSRDLPVAKSAADEAAANFKASRDAQITGNMNAKALQQQRIGASQADRDAFISQANLERQTGLGVHQSSIDSVTSQLSPAQSFSDAGRVLQSSAWNWLNKTLPSKLDALWKPVDTAIPPSTPVSVDNFRSTVNRISQDAGEMTSLTKGIVPKQVASLKKALDNLDKGGAEAAQAELTTGAPQPSTGPKQFTWKDVQSYRRMLGDALSNPETVASYGAANLDALYAALTADMKATASAQGAGNVFDQANAGSSRLYDIARGPISKLVKGKTPEPKDPLPGDAAGRIISEGTGATADPRDISALQAEMPDSMKSLAAASIRNGSWGNLSPEVQAALLPNSGQRSLVNFSKAAMEGVNETADNAISAARQNHEANVALAKNEATGESNQLKLGYMQARSASEAAQQRASQLQAQYDAASAARKTNWHDVLRGALGGGGLGALAEFGEPILSALGVTMPGPLVSGVVGGTLAYTLPKLAKGTKNLVKDVVSNPQSARAAGFGATVGASWPNALTPFQ